MPTDPCTTPPRPKVFVVGCVRSGTSWVRSTLGAHPGALTATESHAFHEAYQPVVAGGAPWASLLDAYDAAAGRGRPVGVHKWLSRDGYAAAVERAARAEASGMPRDQAAAGLVRAVVEGLAEESGAGDVVVVEKTPTHIFWSDVILRRLPEARVVEVVRDGRDACVSMQYRALTERWSPPDRHGQITRWVEALEAGLAARATADARGRWHVVHYEAMKASPRAETARLLEFCGLSTEPATVASVVEANDFRRIADTGAGKHQRRGEVGDWRDHFTAEERLLFRRLAGEVFERAGYSYDDRPSCC